MAEKREHTNGRRSSDDFMLFAKRHIKSGEAKSERASKANAHRKNVNEM